jgi:hypothetical protein
VASEAPSSCAFFTRDAAVSVNGYEDAVTNRLCPFRSRKSLCGRLPGPGILPVPPAVFLLGEIDRINFIKLDIEGAEFETLKDARESINHFKPKLAVSL